MFCRSCRTSYSLQEFVSDLDSSWEEALADVRCDRL
ncbi:MAG: dual CXXC motif small (seleno)protein [Desulfohalobiaceae bacterium]